MSCPAAPAPPSRRRQLASPTAAGMLASGEADSFTVVLARGELLSVVADQAQLDLVLCLYGPDSVLGLALDSPNGQDEPEELLWRARRSGTHTLVVSSLNQTPVARAYNLRIARVPHPSPRECERGDAVLAAARGEELRRSPAPGAWPLARQSYQLALRHWERLGDQLRQADVHARLGRLERERLGELREALASYRHALSLFNTLGERRRAGLVIASMGRTSMYLGEVDQAIGYQRQALQLFTDLQDRREQAVALNEIGYLGDLRGDWQAALDAYTRAMQLWSATSDRAGRATTLHNRGLLYTSLGDDRQALDDLEAARQLREGNRRALAATLSAIGNAHAQAGRPAEGLPFLRQALALRIAAGDLRGEAVTASGLGIVLCKLGRLSEAIALHRRAVAIFSTFGSPRDRARSLHNLGASLAKAGSLAEAAAVLTAAVEGGHATGDEELTAASLLDLARTRSEQGDRLAALSLTRQALASIEAQRLRSPTWSLRSAFFAAKQDFYDFAVELLMDLDRQFPTRAYRIEALDLSERARARSLLDELQGCGVEPGEGLPPELIAARSHLTSAIRLIEGMLWRASSTDDVAPEAPELLAKRLRALLRDDDRLTARIHALAPSYRSLTQAWPVTTADIQRRHLDPDTLLLHYRMGTTRSYLWAVTPTALDVFTLPARDVLEPLARQAHALLSSGDHVVSRAQTDLTLHRLSQALLAPAAGVLGWKRLLIVADGALQTVPFAALPRPGSDPGQAPVPLAVDHEIITLPSASVMVMLKSQQEGRPPAPKRLAVIADPVFSAGDPRVRALQASNPESPGSPQSAPDPRVYPRLRYSQLEAAAIDAAASRGEVFTALGFAASRQLVTSGALGQYQIVHLATHGEIDADHPELSRLVLSLVDEQGRPQDGFLYARDIFDLHLPAELIVLAGCETGLGKEIRGEGLVGLPQAFLYAGAARLVVSLWKVDDRPTALLFKAFYGHLLRDHDTPARALQAAQIESWRQEPWSYNWAAFVSMGRWR